MRLAAIVLSACSVAGAAPATTGSVVGIVTDELGPVAHTSIRVAVEGRDAIYVDSDTNGKYRIDSLEPGEVKFAMSEPSHVTGTRYIAIVGGREVAGDVTLRLHPRAVIDGVVVDAVGPVQGARVEAVDAENADEVSVTTTTADGRYRLAVGDLYVNKVGMNGATIAVRHSGFAPIEHVVSLGRSDSKKTQDFTLAAGGSIAATVRDASHTHPCRMR